MSDLRKKPLGEWTVEDLENPSASGGFLSWLDRFLSKPYIGGVLLTAVVGYFVKDIHDADIEREAKTELVSRFAAEFQEYAVFMEHWAENILEWKQNLWNQAHVEELEGRPDLDLLERREERLAARKEDLIRDLRAKRQPTGTAILMKGAFSDDVHPCIDRFTRAYRAAWGFANQQSDELWAAELDPAKIRQADIDHAREVLDYHRGYRSDLPGREDAESAESVDPLMSAFQHVLDRLQLAVTEGSPGECACANS